jgi:hypothetical protein
MDFSPETVRARFHELTAQAASITAQLDPLRAELDAIVAGTADLSLSAARAREGELRALIRGAQNLLFPIEQERAVCAKALGGKTGLPG